MCEAARPTTSLQYEIQDIWFWRRRADQYAPVAGSDWCRRWRAQCGWYGVRLRGFEPMDDLITDQ